jgi:hypothetical protein
LHHLAVRPRDWEGFFAGAGADPPLAEGVALAREAAREHELVWVTGRPERLRTVTRGWLVRQGLPVARLLMRADGDRRPARLVKRDVLRRLRVGGRIVLVVDDDPQVVAMVEAEGLPVCLADWVPRSETLLDAQERDGLT